MKEPPSEPGMPRRNMGRKAVARGLPALDRIYHGPRNFGEDQHKRDLLEKAMRQIIAQLQVRERRPFYSMREVADFFQVSVPTVTFVYHQLESDGLITMVRGSQTFLEGRGMHSNVALRGVIGVPVYSPAFSIGPQPRKFFIDFEEQLRKHGYLTYFIFFERYDARNDSLAEHILRHKVDAIFYYLAPFRAKECLLRIRDAGVKLVVVNQEEEALPGRRYFRDYRPAFSSLVRNWRERGIRRVCLIDPQREQNLGQQLISHLSSEGIEIERLPFPAEHVNRLADRPHSVEEGYIFLSYRHCEAMCNYDWQAMRDFFNLRVCLLAQGPVFHLGFQTAPVRVDVIEIPYDLELKTIVSDIVSSSAFSDKELHTFSMQFRSGFDLSTVPRPF